MIHFLSLKCLLLSQRQNQCREIHSDTLINISFKKFLTVTSVPVHVPVLSKMHDMWLVFIHLACREARIYVGITSWSVRASHIFSCLVWFWICFKVEVGHLGMLIHNELLIHSPKIHSWHMKWSIVESGAMASVCLSKAVILPDVIKLLIEFHARVFSMTTALHPQHWHTMYNETVKNIKKLIHMFSHDFCDLTMTKRKQWQSN